MKPAISVHNLSKQYRIGKKPSRDNNLTENIRRQVRTAWDKVSRLVTPNKEFEKDESFWALKDVSFEVQPGEVVGIIGRNGAGKSTLLKILSQIVEPTSGHADIRGRMGSLLEVGTGFHPELTGRENIYLNGAILGMKRGEITKKFDEIVAFAEVERFLDTPVKRYSSGMYVRLAFAVAAHLEPEILIVDEVLAVGDVSFQKRCLGKMKDASISGRTVIFVSHNLAAVSQLCSYALHLDKGASIEFDNAHKVVQSFIHNQRSNCIVRKWNEHTSAPGDNIIRLLSIKATQDNNPFDSFDINKDIIISFVYMMQQDTVNLITGISLYNSDGSCLFNSCDWRENKHSRGIYSKDVIIPSQILAEGPINVLAQMVFYDPDIPSVVLPDILQFEAIDSNHPESVRGKYKGKWPGLLRVKLEWKQPIRIDTNTTPHTH